MENLWLLAEMRQPGRSNFLKILLNKRNFNMKKRPVTIPILLGALPLLRIRTPEGSV